MEWLLIIGIAACLIGLGGIGLCILQAARIKNSGLPDAELRKQLGQIIPINFGSVLLSVFRFDYGLGQHDSALIWTVPVHSGRIASIDCFRSSRHSGLDSRWSPPLIRTNVISEQEA